MRLKEAFKEKDVLGRDHLALNAKFGSQQGYMPSLGAKMEDGKTYEEWLNDAAFVSVDVIPFVLSTPKYFDFFDNPKDWTDLFISIFELHPETIDGLDATLTVETDQHNVGRGGQTFKEVTGVKRPETSVKYTLREKRGKPINRFLDIYIRYCIQDHELGKPLVTLMPKFKKGLHTPDMYSFSTLFVEPDITHNNVIEAYLVLNQFPTTAGTVTSKRDLSTGGEMVVYDIETGGIMVYNESIRKLGQHFLDSLTVTSVNPDTVVSALNPEDLQATVKDSKFKFNSTGDKVKGS